MYRYYFIRADISSALAVAEHLLSLAKKVNDKQLLVEAHRAAGNSLAGRGDYTSARVQFDACSRVISSLPAAQGKHTILLSDSQSACDAVAALVLWNLGYPDQGFNKSRQSLTRARELKHPYNLAMALNFACVVHHLCGHIDEAKRCADESIALSKQYRFPFWLAGAMIFRGWITVSENDSKNGMRLMRDGFEMYESIGAEVFKPYYNALLADALQLQGEYQQAIDTLTMTENATSKNGEHWWDAAIHRKKGVLMFKNSNADIEGARRCFNKAIHVAKQQNARSLELSATTALAELDKMASGPATAYHDLCAILDSFKEGHNTKDYRRALSLRNELSTRG